jgi:hypothetical protein
MDSYEERIVYQHVEEAGNTGADLTRTLTPSARHESPNVNLIRLLFVSVRFIHRRFALLLTATIVTI